MAKSKRYPLGAFMNEFSTEAKCREYMANLRWAGGFVCPKCGCRHACLLSNGRYQCADCRRQTSVTAGTVLHKSHMPLILFFLLGISVAILAVVWDTVVSRKLCTSARRKLAEHGIDCAGKTARQLKNRDYNQYDLLIGMDKANLRNMHRICSGDYDGKIHPLLEYAGRPDDEVADPWYTDDFEATWQDVLAGCLGLLDFLQK